MTEEHIKKTLVLGVGNILMKDDGLGVHVVREIEERGIQLPDDVELFDGGTLGFDLMYIMSGREKILIIDALKTDDRPGSVYRFPARHLAKEARSFSLHDVGVSMIIDMLKLLDENPEIEIIGVVPEDINTLEIGMSPPVCDAVPVVIDLIVKTLSG